MATPGHTSNHLCFALEGAGALFTGDHVMGWSTTVVSPPDGDMTAYMKSLDLLLGRDDRVYHPAHGPAVEDPHAHVRAPDRPPPHAREADPGAISRRGRAASRRWSRPCTATSTRACIRAAGRSVLAHLVDMERRGLVEAKGEIWMLRA